MSGSVNIVAICNVKSDILKNNTHTHHSEVVEM